MAEQIKNVSPLEEEKVGHTNNVLSPDENKDVADSQEKPESADNSFSVSAPDSSANGLENHFEKLSIPVTKYQNGHRLENESDTTDLYTKINSKDFEIFHCISLLEHNDNIGIQYYICKRIQKFPIGELRFFAPQFLQLLITMETQSMALEEMIKVLCFRDPHFGLIIFWHLQAMLQDLS